MEPKGSRPEEVSGLTFCSERQQTVYQSDRSVSCRCAMDTSLGSRPSDAERALYSLHRYTDLPHNRSFFLPAILREINALALDDIQYLPFSSSKRGRRA